MKNKLSNLAFLNSSLSIAAVGDDEIVVFPDGAVELLGEDDLQVTKASADSLIAAFVERGVKVPVDYEHSTKFKAGKGEPSPAAGWITSLRYEKGSGIIGHVEWTDDAKKLIKDQKYKYLSPHFGVNDKREPTFLLAVALTNTPRIKNMRELIAASAVAEKENGMPKDEKQALPRIAKLVAASALTGLEAVDDTMIAALDQVIYCVDSIRQYLASVGKIPLDSKPSEVLKAAIEELKSGTLVAAISPLAAKLGLAVTASVTDVGTAVDKLIAGSVPAADYAKIAERLKAIEASETARAVDALVTAAITDGKINPNDAARVKWAKDFATRDVEGFKLIVAGMSPVFSTGSLTGSLHGKPHVTGTGNRGEIIASAVQEYNADPRAKHFPMPGIVNRFLADAGFGPLTDTEKAGLVVAPR